MLQIIRRQLPVSGSLGRINWVRALIWREYNCLSCAHNLEVYPVESSLQLLGTEDPKDRTGRTATGPCTDSSMLVECGLTSVGSCPVQHELLQNDVIGIMELDGDFVAKFTQVLLQPSCIVEDGLAHQFTQRKIPSIVVVKHQHMVRLPLLLIIGEGRPESM